MAGNLAETSFSSGPNDQAAAADAYSGATPVNAGASSEQTEQTAGEAGKELAKKAAQSIKNSPAAVSEALKTVDISGGSVDTSGSAKRLQAVLGGGTGPFNDLLGDLQAEGITALAQFTTGQPVDKADIKKLLSKNPASSFGGLGGIQDGARNVSGLNIKSLAGIKTIYDNTTMLLETDDYRTATGVTEILNAIIPAGNPLYKALDIESQMAVVDMVIKKALELGIPQAIDKIIDHIEDEKQRDEMILRNLRSAILYSDLETVDWAIDQVGAAGVFARVPDAITLIITFYRFKPETRTNQYTSLLNQLINLLVRLDANWDKFNRDGTLIRNLEPFSYMSEDAKVIFATNNTYRDLTLFAQEYPSRGLVAMAQQLYPKTYFETNGEW